MRVGSISSASVAWGMKLWLSGRDSGGRKTRSRRACRPSRSPPTARYTTGVTGWKVGGGPSSRRRGPLAAAASRKTARASDRSTSLTFTGGTSVMWAGMRPRVSSPRARRRPSSSVATGAGTSSATPRRCRAMRSPLSARGRAGGYGGLAGEALLDPGRPIGRRPGRGGTVAVTVLVHAALDHLALLAHAVEEDAGQRDGHDVVGRAVQDQDGGVGDDVAGVVLLGQRRPRLGLGAVGHQQLRGVERGEMTQDVTRAAVIDRG